MTLTPEHGDLAQKAIALGIDGIYLTVQRGQMKNLNATDFKAGCLALLDEGCAYR